VSRFHLPDLLSFLQPTGNQDRIATFNTTLRVPSCPAISTSCRTGTNLINNKYNNESNTPNSLDSCTDGSLGTYLSDESIEAISVRSLSGTLRPGATAEIMAQVWAYSNGTEDYADFYYASDANAANWVFIGTARPNGGGAKTLLAQYTVPAGAAVQAVRVNFRWRGNQGGTSGGSCNSGSYDDVDDLAFVVDSANIPDQIGGLSEMPKPRPMKEVPKQEFTCDSLSSDRCNASKSSCSWVGKTNERGAAKKGSCQPRHRPNNWNSNFN